MTPEKMPLYTFAAPGATGTTDDPEIAQGWERANAGIGNRGAVYIRCDVHAETLAAFRDLQIVVAKAFEAIKALGDGRDDPEGWDRAYVLGFEDAKRLALQLLLVGPEREGEP